MTSGLREALARLAARRERYLFLDYDGTLSPIVSRAEEATPHPESVRWLRILVRLPRTTVAVVTGRPLEDLRRRLPVGEIIVAAVHGLRIQGGGVDFDHAEALQRQPAVRRVRDRLRETLHRREGVDIEDKGLTVAVHYRRAGKDDARAAARQALRIARETKSLEALEGKKVVEIRPRVDWDKGRAVELILERLAGPGWPDRAGVLYLGDDRTDEDAFQRLAGRAVTVRVGEEGPSGAGYRVKDPGEVAEVLGELASLLATDSPAVP